MRKYIVILKLSGNAKLIEKFYELVRHAYQHSVTLLSGAIVAATKDETWQIEDTLHSFAAEINNELKEHTIPLEDNKLGKEWIEPLKIQELFMTELAKEHKAWLGPEKQGAFEYILKQ